MLASVTCAGCGARIREDRSRCLRCGAALNAGRGEADAAGHRVRTMAMVVAIVALGGFAVLLVGRSAGDVPAVTAASAGESTRAETRGGGPGPLRPDAAAVSAAVDPAALSMEASRAAIAAYRQGDVAGSVEQFSAAAEADPRNADALNNLGQALVRAGRARDAIPYFDRAIAISDSTWAYRFNRARAFAELREWNRAIADYRSAASLFPEDYATAFNLAKALQANGDLAGAITEYGRAIELAPSDEPDFYLALANALDSAGRRAGALAIYRQALDLQVAPAEAEKIKARIKELQSQP